ncbi:MAG: lysylphosphatidylglycerol synthase transmembrane domain-containing protein [bacterium]
MRTRRIFFVFKVAIALGVMVILVKTVNFQGIYTAFRNPEEPVFIYLAILLLIPNLFIQWYRWRYLLRFIQPDVGILESVSSLFGGMLMGFVTPGRIGEMGRSLFLRRIDRLQALGLVFVDKFYSFVTIVVGGVWGIVLLVIHLIHRSAFIVWPLSAVALMITASGFVLLLHPQWIRGFLYNLTLILPYRDKLRHAIQCMDRFDGDGARIFVFLSFSLYFIFILQFCLLALAFERISLLSAFSATASTFFAKSLLPISLADLGIREGASIYFFMKFQVENVTAFNSALLLFTINVLLPTLCGVFFLPRLGWKEKQIP